jgi:peptidoglycan hydrolase-like protein with peptidoglycan-binding domain
MALLLTLAAALCTRPCSAAADTPSAKPKPHTATHAGATSGSAKGSSTKEATAKPGAARSSKHLTVSSKSGVVTSTAPAIGKSAASKSSGKSSVTKSGKRTSSKTSSRHAPGQKAPTPERITEIQQALAKNGAFSGEPSGKWDDSTTEGMRKFQAAHGLNPTGRLDALTLRQLGLGSTTAGMGAPTISSKASASTLPSDVAAPQ